MSHKCSGVLHTSKPSRQSRSLLSYFISDSGGERLKKNKDFPRSQVNAFELLKHSIEFFFD